MKFDTQKLKDTDDETFDSMFYEVCALIESYGLNPHTWVIELIQACEDAGGRLSMYLYDTIKGEKAVEFCQTNLKMEPSEYDLDAVNRVEVFATSLEDEGNDYCEYRVYDCHNKLTVSRRELGY